MTGFLLMVFHQVIADTQEQKLVFHILLPASTETEFTPVVFQDPEGRFRLDGALDPQLDSPFTVEVFLGLGLEL